MKEDIQVMYLPPVFNIHNQFSKTLQLDNNRFLLWQDEEDDGDYVEEEEEEEGEGKN